MCVLSAATKEWQHSSQYFAQLQNKSLFVGNALEHFDQVDIRLATSNKAARILAFRKREKFPPRSIFAPHSRARKGHGAIVDPAQSPVPS